MNLIPNVFFDVCQKTSPDELSPSNPFFAVSRLPSLGAVEELDMTLELVTAIPTELPLSVQRRCIEQILAKKSISEIEDFLKELVAHRRELSAELEQLARKEKQGKSPFWVEITILSSREADSLELVLQRLRFLRTRVVQLDRFLYLLVGEKQP